MTREGFLSLVAITMPLTFFYKLKIDLYTCMASICIKCGTVAYVVLVKVIQILSSISLLSQSLVVQVFLV